MSKDAAKSDGKRWLDNHKWIDQWLARPVRALFSKARSKLAALARVALVLGGTAVVLLLATPLDVSLSPAAHPSLQREFLEDDGLFEFGRFLLVLAGSFMAWSVLSLTWRGRPVNKLGPAEADDVKQLAEGADASVLSSKEAAKLVSDLRTELAERQEALRAAAGQIDALQKEVDRLLAGA